ncbi:MAG: 2-oxoacid:acceptor oxidoreductase subunit alpha [Bacillota bacterium]
MSEGNRRLMQGNEAVVEAALVAGCRFFAGYPITPSTEIAELLSARLPRVGGRFIQMEDEIASMGAAIGSSLTGTKAMTATSGPGFSLKQENLGFASLTEVPVVVVNVQRMGPSTGMPTSPSQGDVMQARWGTHGDHPIVTLAPASVDETYRATVHAFNVSEGLRVPVVLLLDEVIGHMREGVNVPRAEDLEIVDRKGPSKPPKEHLPYEDDGTGIPEMAAFGRGYRYHVTGLFHDETGFPDMTPATADKLMRRLMGKMDRHRDVYEWVEPWKTEDAEILVLTYGSPAQAARSAVRRAREEGMKVGEFRLVTIWPFPEELLEESLEGVRAVVVPEMNLGQLRLEVERVVAGRTPVVGINRTDGELFKPDEIYEKIREVYAGE